MAKTLTDFRAEKGLYLKDLAAEIGIPEDELRAVEESGAVPEDLGQRIIAQYALPADYFAEPIKIEVKAVKKMPAKPMLYFTLVSFVAMFITDLIAELPTFLYSMSRMFISFFSIASNNEIELDDPGPFWDIFDSMFNSAVIILFGILFVNFIANHTAFEGKIKKYRFLYYIWPFAATGFALDIAGLISTAVLSNSQNAADPMTSTYTTLAFSSIVSIISLVVSILAAYLCARLLNAAALGDESKQTKELRLLAIFVTASTVISLVVFIVRMIMLKDFSPLSITTSLLAKTITVAVIWIAATVKPKNEKQEKLIFTILPIIAMCDSVVYTIINVLVG